MVSMARPFLADRLRRQRPRDGKRTSTPASPATRPAWTIPSPARSPPAWNPRACHETESRSRRPRRRASLWSAPAGGPGLRDHRRRTRSQGRAVRGRAQIGGQFQHRERSRAREFAETLRYFGRRIGRPGSTEAEHPRLGRRAGRKFDVVLATGINAARDAGDRGRRPSQKVLWLPRRAAGQQARRPSRRHPWAPGGIGFDVAEPGPRGGSPSLAPAKFYAEMGHRRSLRTAAGSPPPPYLETAARDRAAAAQGDQGRRGLGKTTGWIHRTALKNRGVRMIAGVTYRRIDDAGLHVSIGGKDEVLAVDQRDPVHRPEPQRELRGRAGRSRHARVHLIGGADVAAEPTPSARSSRASSWRPASRGGIRPCTARRPTPVSRRRQHPLPQFGHPAHRPRRPGRAGDAEPPRQGQRDEPADGGTCAPRCSGWIARPRCAWRCCTAPAPTSAPASTCR